MERPGELTLRRVLANSRMLSSDVSSGFDALYASAFDKKNVAYLGKGVVFNKFTGARGKSGSNDANAEYLGQIRDIMDKNKVRFQLSELGRVDLGGGGTIAYIMALYGMNVIDSGVPVLSMHAPGKSPVRWTYMKPGKHTPPLSGTAENDGRFSEEIFWEIFWKFGRSGKFSLDSQIKLL